MFPNFRLVLGNSVQCTSKRYAGHSKWQNIKHTKLSNDTARNNLFMKIGQRIRIAIADGGRNADPSSNLALAQAIEVARSKSVPNATVQNFIKQAQLDKSNGKTVWYDILGPRGSFFIVQTHTDNATRTKCFIQGCIKKHNLKLENNLRSQFIHRGIIRTRPKIKPEQGEIMDVCIEHAITVGAEDVVADTENSEIVIFYCNPVHVTSVKDKLVALEYEIEDADEYYIPVTTVTLQEENVIEDLSKALDKLQALPEVVRIYDNIA